MRKTNAARRLAMIAIPSFALFLLVILPLLMALYSGFFSGGRVTLSAFSSILGSDYYLGVIAFTFKQAAVSVLVVLALGLPGAYLVSNYDFRFKHQILALATVPFVLPSVLVVLGFVIFFGNTGVLNNALRDFLGIEGVPFGVLYSWKAIVLAHAFYNIPLVLRYVSSVWREVDESMLEAALNVGASRARVFKDIELPFLSQAILSCALLVFIYSFTSFAIVLALGGPQYATMEVTIYTVTNFFGSFELAGALATIQMIFLLCVVLIFMRIDVRRMPGRARALSPLSGMSALGKAATGAYSIIVGTLLFGPMASILHSSISSRGAGAAYTLDWFREIFDVGRASFIGATPLESILNSLTIAVVAMAISVGIGLLFSYYQSGGGPGRRLVGVFVMVPLCVSTITLSLGYLMVGNRLALDISLLSIILIHSVLSLPFSYRAISNSLSKVDGALIEASVGLGASRLRTFLSIDLPLIKGGVVAAAVFSFAISLGELAAAYMLYGGRYTTIPIYIYRFIGGYRFGPAAALGVILMAVSAISFVMIDRSGAKLRL